MIRIVKPPAPPEILGKNGKRKRAVLCGLYTKFKDDYISGDRKFSFDGTLYGDVSVKEALIAAQHGKCCFCESRIGADGDVEHFRPKAGWSQGKGYPMLRPGYYWLVYEWDNLFLACGPCNQRFKKNYFPLADAATHAASHDEDMTREDALLIDPTQRDPEELIGWRHEIPYAIEGNPYGETTIQMIGLTREIFNERRRDHLAKLNLLFDLVRLADAGNLPAAYADLVADARLVLARAVEDDAEFAAATRAAFRDEFAYALG